MGENKVNIQELVHLDSAALSNRGLRRELNQDAIFHQTSQTRTGEGLGLFIVCDGMGGQHAGEIASRIAVDTISDELVGLFAGEDTSEKSKTLPSKQASAHPITAAIEKANAEIRHYVKHNRGTATKMGTTATLALVRGHLVDFANVGDGRAYLWRQGMLRQVTQDHSLAAKLAAEGVIESNDVYYHPHNNIILRALGIGERVEVDLFEEELEIGDKLLICSDGLWKAFGSADKLVDWLDTETTPADLCQQLVQEAKLRDGSDNISVIIVEVKPVADC